VVAFLTFMFLKTPSGSNCKTARFAIANRCRVYGLEDPTKESKFLLLLDGMTNLSSVASKRVRQPWALSFCRMWIGCDLHFVEERNYVMYTCIMILGLRTMLRGSEIGGILVSYIAIVNSPHVGVKILCRKIKNGASGRVVCIEATGGELCPLRWLNRLLRIKEKGPFLFAGSFALSTVEISWILRLVASYIGIDGKYSSHSLRIGGASEAAFAGFNNAAIMAISEWNSAAIDKYFRSEFSSNRNVSQQLGF
jgi:hypothetical protein